MKTRHLITLLAITASTSALADGETLPPIHPLDQVGIGFTVGDDGDDQVGIGKSFNSDTNTAESSLWQQLLEMLGADSTAE